MSAADVTQQQGSVVRPERFAALDSWRGVCAAWVALYHLRSTGHYYETTLVQYGFLAVDFFFILSGFVIAYAYGHKLGGGPARIRFVIRRFGRLYPLHFFTLLIVLAMELVRLGLTLQLGRELGPPPFSGNSDVPAFFANLFLVQGLGFYDDFGWNVPSWSISVELFVCLVFVAASLVRRPLLAAIVLVLIGFALRTWMGVNHATMTDGDQALTRGIYGFFLGVLVHAAFQWWRGRGRGVPGWLEWTTPVLFILAILLHRWHFLPLSVLAFAALVFIFAFEAGPVSRLLKWRPLLHIGEISYSTYLMHYVLVLAMFGAAAALAAFTGLPLLADREGSTLLDIGGPWGGDLLAVVFLGLTFLAGTFTYRWIEVPGRGYFNRLSDRVGRKAS